MIRVTVKENKDKKITSIEVKGHSLSDSYGKDLICAGTSSVVTGAYNSIADKKKFILILDDGYALIETKGEELPEHDAVVLEVLYTSLKCIEEVSNGSMKIKIV